MYFKPGLRILGSLSFIFLQYLNFVSSTNQNCPLYWSAYANVCYRFRWVNLKSWNEAKAWCASQGGDLLKLENNSERTYITNAIKNIVQHNHLRNAKWWLGMNNKNPQSQAWVWGDKSPVTQDIISGAHLHQSTTDHCVYISGTAGLVNTQCWQKYAYICERPRGTPLTCDATRGWQQFNNFCYQVHPTDVQTWSGAVQVCSRNGGDLVEIDNDQDQIAIHDFARNTKRPLWTALHSVQTGNTNNWQWLNGTVMTSNRALQYWANGQPPVLRSNMLNRTCVWMNNGQQDYHKSWSTDNCNVRKGFVCKRPEGVCMPGWVPHQKLCFLFNIRFKYNWYQANRFCKSSGGNLVSIYGTTFTNFLNSYLDELQSAGIDSFWIGLTDNNKTGGPWMWTNGGNIQHYQHWPGNHAARNTPNKQDCGYIYSGDRSGSWRTTNNCATQKAFVCQIPMGKRVNPVTTPRPQFKCTGHWLLFNGNCYQFNDTRLSWLNARQTCQNAGADLVTINSATIQSYILRQSHGKEYWIGLNDRTQEGRWQWLDGTTGSKYYHWNAHEPNNLGTENCVEMNFMNHQGKWNDRQCSTLVRFICQKPASNAQLPVSVSTTAAMPISVRCGLNWEEDPNSNNCYQFYDKQLDWMDAREVCRNGGGDLASIESRVEQAYIAGKINNMNSIALWIGINDRATENKFVWVDGSPVAYLHWANGEPNNYRNRNEDCGNMYTSTSYWNDSPCNGRNGFICKKQSSQRTTTTPPPPVVTKAGYVMGCQDGYQPFQGNCYHLWQIRQNWNAAKSFCHRQGSLLATINSREEQNFVMTMIPKYGYGYWIGLNDLANQMTFFWSDGSPVLYTNWAAREPNNYGHKNEDCVLMLRTNGQWNDAICQNPADGFICKKPMTLMSATPKPESVGCTWPAYGYGSYCYRFVYQTKTWQDAQKICVNAFHGTLASINDRFTEAFLSAYMSYQTDYFWIGLSDTQTQGTYKWVNGVPVTYSNWVATHTGNEIASCVALTSRHPKGLWENLNCTDQHHFICQLPRQGFTTPAITTPPASLPCPGGYSGYQSYCYKAIGLTDNTQWMSFTQARDYCQGYGGDLASIHSAGENSFIKTLTRSASVDSWIGLNDRDVESGHKWTDGSATDYTQWNRGEPNNFADTEDCVVLTRGSGGWNDVNCFFSKPFVCKVAKGVQLSTTAVLPTASTSGSCGTGWVFYNQFCYYIGNGTTLMTWFDARSTCNQMGAELASIHSQDEDNMLVGQYTKTKRTVDYWIGLNDIEYNSKYVWTDGSLLDFVSWSPHEPNDYGGGENCVTMPFWTGGKWNDDNCNMKKNYICKRPVTGSTKPINPGTTAIIAAGCPNPNFKPVPHSNRCFFIVQNKVNWTDAVSACRTAYPGASLATISSLQEQLFLNSMLFDKDPKLTLWIGLNDLRQSRRFTWADNSPLTFVNWYKGEPNNSPDGSNVKWNSERCVEMYASNSAAGQWNDKQCGAMRNFVCQQHRQTGVAVTSVQGACPSGFAAFGASCYRYFPPNGAAGSWTQAQQVCQQNNAQLVVISNVYEDGFVQSLAGDLAPSGYWIGMADQTSSGTYTWVQSGWPVTYTNWGAGEPTKSTGEGCVAIMNHKWNDTQCNQQLGFVCHINNNTPLPTPPQSSVSCDGNAPIAVGDSCYYISGFKTKTWPEASYLCERMGMELASFHSIAEMNIILQRFQNYQAQPGETAPRYAENIWLGMTKGFSDGFQWKDGSAVNFLNWDKGEPSDAMSSSQEECVEMYTNSGKWNDVTCFTKRRYVCKKAAQMSTVGFKLTSGNLPPLNPNPGTTGYNPWAPVSSTNFPTNRITPSRQTLQPITQPQGMGNPNAAPQQQSSSSISGSLSAGGLAGLLVAIIFILGLFAFGIIFLKRRQYPAGSGVQGAGGFENAMYYSSEGAVNMKNNSKEEDA